MLKHSGNPALAGWSIAKIPTHRGKYLLSAILIWGVSTSCKLFAESYGQAKSVVKPVRTTLKAKTNGVPTEINYQGWIGNESDTTGITDAIDMKFRLYDDSTGGSVLWNESQNAVSVNKGIFNVMLGIANPISSKYFYDGAQLWLETQVENDTLSPRKKLVSVGYAMKSDYADSADHAIHSDTAGYASSSAPDSDWTLSGSKLYAQNTSWNVGIGTTSPSTDARLSVNANGASYGVYGQGSTGKTAGVWGWACGAGYGVCGTGSTDGMAGMLGSAAGADYGVTGVGSPGGTAGVYGFANGANYAGYFDGDVHIDGEVTIDTVVRYYSIPANDFNPYLDTYTWTRPAGALYTSTSGATEWLAGVNLPDGAVVTEVNGYVYDTDAAQDVTVWLLRCQTGSSSIMTSASSTGSGGAQTITDNTINNATIDNENYAYCLDVLLRTGNSKHQLHQVRIKYEITSPLP